MMGDQAGEIQAADGHFQVNLKDMAATAR